MGCCICGAASVSPFVRQKRTALVKAYAAEGIEHQRVCRMRTKWARYEHRFHSTTRLLSYIQAHECNQSHKLARDVLCRRPEMHLALAPLLQPEPKAASAGPEEAAASSAGPEAAAWGAAGAEAAACGAGAKTGPGKGEELAATSDLFKGRVPQVQEWLDAWADTSSGVSFLKQGEISRKRHGKGNRFQRKIGRRFGGDCSPEELHTSEGGIFDHDRA